MKAAPVSARQEDRLAAELEKAGAHLIALKDMAGLLKPSAARILFKALREATDLPQYQRPPAHALIDAGADLIVGHHPHIIHGVERHGRGVVTYSLGDGRRNRRARGRCPKGWDFC